MEYQKASNLLDDTLNQSSKFRTRNPIEINDASRGTCNVSNQIKFKISMVRSYLCDYSDAYIHVKGTITVPNTVRAAAPNNRNTKVIFKNCAPFTNSISEINDTHLDDAHDIDAVMSMHSLIEYSDNSKMSKTLSQYDGDEPTLNNNIIIDFPADNNNSISLKFK